jgi:hypothetical protein
VPGSGSDCSDTPPCIRTIPAAARPIGRSTAASIATGAVMSGRAVSGRRDCAADSIPSLVSKSLKAASFEARAARELHQISQPACL